MTREQFASVLTQEVSDRVSAAVKDLYEFCDTRGEPLTKDQRFAVGSMPLRITLDLGETFERMVRTYTAICAVSGDTDMTDDLVSAWLRDLPTERTH